VLWPRYFRIPSETIWTWRFHFENF
jgi:hypothetical protein